MHVFDPDQVLMATIAGGRGRRCGREIPFLRLQEVASGALFRRAARAVKWTGSEALGQYLLFTRDGRKEKKLPSLLAQQLRALKSFHFDTIETKIQNQGVVLDCVLNFGFVDGLPVDTDAQARSRMVEFDYCVTNAATSVNGSVGRKKNFERLFVNCLFRPMDSQLAKKANKQR